jgi:alpha-tubulin suppressor-like RCC1 family protein
MDYEVYGCGWNENGQVGVGTSKVVWKPQPIPPLRFETSSFNEKKTDEEKQHTIRYTHIFAKYLHVSHIFFFVCACMGG